MRARCCLICVGSELLRGKVNAHASYLARRLSSIGLTLDQEITVSDELPQIVKALRAALADFHVVFAAGGLGPTFDDLTREAAATATGRRLSLSQPLLREITAKFRHAHYRMPQANVRQAYVLEGARAIPNTVGTAPGQWLELKNGSERRRAKGEERRRGGVSPLAPRPTLLVLLPGPPRELIPMVERFVLPALQKCFPARPQVGAHLHFVGVPESVVDDKIRPIIQREKKRAGDSIQFTILAHLGLVDFDVFVSSDTLTQARRTLRRVVKSIRRVLGEALYGMDADYPLEKVVGDQLRRRDATLAVAESCTGGLLAARVTNIPGSSDYFLGGSVTYANAAKVRELGVPESLLHRYGAVSKPVALAMARGVRERAGSTWGVGITGIAGPGGGTRQKPVGLVFIAVASVKASVCQEYRFTGDRAAVRERAVLSALDLLRKTLGRTVQKSL